MGCVRTMGLEAVKEREGGEVQYGPSQELHPAQIPKYHTERRRNAGADRTSGTEPPTTDQWGCPKLRAVGMLVFW